MVMVTSHLNVMYQGMFIIAFQSIYMYNALCNKNSF